MEKKSEELSSRDKARESWKKFLEDLTSGLVDIITDEDNRFTKAENKRMDAMLNAYTARLLWKAVLLSSFLSGMLFAALTFVMKYMVNK